MKKTVFVLSVVAFAAMFGCSKEKENEPNQPALDNQVLISEIFNAGMSGYSESMNFKSSWPVNESVDYIQFGTQGGTIHVTGSVTGSISMDDNTGYVTGGILQIGLTETINDYTFNSNGGLYTMNGAPYVSLTGTFTLAPGGATFGTASSMQIGGAFSVTGPGVDRTINIQITININSNGSGGHVSGTYGGEPIDYTF